MKKILIIGNKQLNHNIDCTGYDIVVQFNRMMNFKNCPVVHWWFTDLCYLFRLYVEHNKVDFTKDIDNTLEKVFMDTFWNKEKYYNCLLNYTTTDKFNFINTHIRFKNFSGCFTTDFLYIAYIVNKFGKDYDITLTAIDVYNRKDILDKLSSHHNTAHINALDAEEKILTAYINKHKLHFIDE